MCSAQQKLCQGQTNTGPTWTTPIFEKNTTESNPQRDQAENIAMKDEDEIQSDKEFSNSDEESIKTPSPPQSDTSEDCIKSRKKRCRTKSKKGTNKKPAKDKKSPSYSVTILKGFDCPFCDKSYKNQRDMNAHKKTHVFLNDIKPVYVSKGFDCPTCEKSYKHKQDLLRHRRKHKRPGEEEVKKSKGFDCPKCGNTYAYKKGLQRHMKYSCGPNDPLDCPVCHKKLKQLFTLNDHLKLFHMDYYKSTLPPKQLVRIVEDPANPSYICHQCSKQYTYRKGLMRHLQLECGMEPQFQCHVCSKRIRRHLTLKKHLSMKHGIND